MNAISPYASFPVHVAAVRRLSPTFVRVTLTGESLRQFATGGAAGNRDRRVALLFPTPGHPLPRLGSSGDPADLRSWYQRWLAADPATRGSMRTYTVRKTRIDGAGTDPQIDIDFVIHQDGNNGSGPGSRWASGAREGGQVIVIGPHADRDNEEDIAWRPGEARRVLLLGDEAAAPAIATILESLPAGRTGRAFIEVPSYGDILSIGTTAGIEVTWLPREQQARGARLEWAARAHLIGADGPRPGETPDTESDSDLDDDLPWQLPESAHGGFYAWIAGEAAVVRRLRRLLVNEVGIDRRQIAFMGYWREGRVGHF